MPPKLASQAGPRIKQEPCSSTSTPQHGNDTFDEQQQRAGASPATGSAKSRTFSALRDLSGEASSTRLDCGIAAAKEWLTSLASGMKKSSDKYSPLAQIEKLLASDVSGRTIIGVVGTTGAGKSSLINALLEEEQLVPTSCMRACTAVATEISYNRYSDAMAKYSAQIEFLREDEWRQEVVILLGDLLDENDELSSEIHDSDSLAAKAYDKLRAVYPGFNVEDATTTALLSHPEVNKVLGKTFLIRETDPRIFYHRLKSYVDAKERNDSQVDSLAHWPLIKVVRLFVKADALKTGAVIVDLPGAQDDDAARTAVANRYMAQCDVLWVVAPITRAVNDKTAKDILGAEFKRQMRFDGTYLSASSICSKTDDVSIREALESFDIRDKVRDAEQTLKRLPNHKKKLVSKMRSLKLHRRTANAELKRLRKARAKAEASLNRMRKTKSARPMVSPRKSNATASDPGSKVKTENDETLAATIDLTAAPDGSVEVIDNAGFAQHMVLSPTVSPRKRNATPLTRARTRIKLEKGGTAAIVDPSIDAERSEAEANHDGQTPVTIEGLQLEINRLVEDEKILLDEQTERDAEFAQLESAIAEIPAQRKEAKHNRNRICIDARNAYSRSAMKQNFVDGLKELDQEAALEEDPEGYDSTIQARDYAAIADKLPVFCVSSRAYQKLCGRHAKDSVAYGFYDVQHTELPQLIQHCQVVPRKRRNETCQEFLLEVHNLFTSVLVWSAVHEGRDGLTSSKAATERKFLKCRLDEFKLSTDRLVLETFQKVEQTLRIELIDYFDTAVKAAIDSADTTSEKWGMPRAEGGLHFHTYRAVTRRYGVFESRKGGKCNFNGDLTTPIYDILAPNWVAMFQRHIPEIMDSFAETAFKALTDCHEGISTRCNTKRYGSAQLATISQNLGTFLERCQRLARTAVHSIDLKQREINRQFDPAIQNALRETYHDCAEECGPGSHHRRKSRLSAQIVTRAQQMFEDAAKLVEDCLIEGCREIQTQTHDSMNELFAGVRQNYLRMLEKRKLSQQERITRREAANKLDAAELAFKEIMDTRIEDLKVPENPRDCVDDPREDIGELINDAIVLSDSESDHENEQDSDALNQDEDIDTDAMDEDDSSDDDGLFM